MAAKLKEMLGPRMYALVRRVVFACRAATLRFAALGAFPSAVYYSVLSRAFDREHLAVAVAVRRNLQNHPDVSLYKLRRNIHRIEKGLLMRPRRSPFALDYIDETVELFLALDVDRVARASQDIEWAGDVLAEYFEAVGSDPRLANVGQRFANQRTADGGRLRVPASRTLGEPVVGYEQFLALMQQRRSVRWFEQRPVPRDMIDRAVLAASHAPSACNRQPYRYLVFDDSPTVQEIAAIPLGTAGFRENIPAIVCLVGDLSAFFGARDRHGIYVDASLSAMAFMLALESQGLSSCPLNWPDIGSLERDARKRLDLQDHERIVMFIAVGYPDPAGMVAHSQRRDLVDVREYARS